MKRNPDYLLRVVAQSRVVVPVGKAAEAFPGMVNLNETGEFLWELLATEQTVESLAAALEKEYGVPNDQALTDVENFLFGLLKIGAVQA